MDREHGLEGNTLLRYGDLDEMLAVSGILAQPGPTAVHA